MRKLFKKSIACVLAAILCVSLCVCAIPASAEAITFSTNAVSAKAGDAVTIDFEIADFAAVKAAQIKLVLPEAIASIDSVSLNGDALVATEDVFEIGEGYVKLQALFGDSEYDDFAAADSLVLSIAATVADVEAGTYAYGDAVVNLYSETAALDVDGAFGEFKVVEEPAGPVEPVYDENFKFNSANVTLASSIALNFDMNKTTVDPFESGYVVFEKPVYNADGSLKETLTVTLDFEGKTQSAANASRYAFTFAALYPQDLGATITATPYGVKDGVTYVGKSQNYSILTFIKSNYSKDAKYPALFANLLNYGTVVQSENGYNTANMIDEAYTALVGNDDWKADITTEARALVNSQVNSPLTGATAKITGASVSLADKVIVNLKTADANKAPLDYAAGYKMKFTYTNAAGAQEVYYDITEEYVAFDALSASEMSVVFSAVIVDAEGNEVSNAITYSIETFCSKTVNAQTVALMKYGDAVAALNA